MCSPALYSALASHAIAIRSSCFLREIYKVVPDHLDIHAIVDNYRTHEHPKVIACLSAHARWHLHFVPTYSSCLNLVERFFALITDKAIRRRSFQSVKDLT